MLKNSIFIKKIGLGYAVCYSTNNSKKDTFWVLARIFDYPLAKASFLRYRQFSHVEIVALLNRRYEESTINYHNHWGYGCKPFNG